MSNLKKSIEDIKQNIKDINSEDNIVDNIIDNINLKTRISNIIYSLNITPISKIFFESRLNSIQLIPPSSKNGKEHNKKLYEKDLKNLQILLDDIYNSIDNIDNERPKTVEEDIRNKKNIFIVHGHDELMKEKVENFLRGELKLQPIVLHKMPNEGRTIIEKFEEYSNVKYAVILFSPDDLLTSKKGNDIEKKFYRVRQNVILELGFFLGKLGRKNVCVLKKDTENHQDYDIPSDYSGILFIPYNSNNEEWMYKLRKELVVAKIIKE